MSNRILPAFLKMPELPRQENVAAWIHKSLFIFLNSIYKILADRSEEMIQEGPFAQMPPASGKRRFYYDTDNDDLYYDAGSWKKAHFT